MRGRGDGDGTMFDTVTREDNPPLYPQDHRHGRRLSAPGIQRITNEEPRGEALRL